MIRLEVEDRNEESEEEADPDLSFHKVVPVSGAFSWFISFFSASPESLWNM